MMRKLAMTAALVVALAAAGYAQNPDFSGTWTPDPAPDAAAGGGGGRGMGGPMTVTQTATELKIERQGPNGAVTQVYKLDGTETDLQMGQMTAKVSAKWDGGKLVITQKSERGESTQTWSLADGKLKIDRTGGRGPSSTTYKKTT
jgi:opacity protein-like surface antigen